jgi:RimJ/RimL family protein N-acetyltransferase
VATEVRLRDGTQAITWALLPSDREGLREAYEHLSSRAKLHRFLAPVPHLTETMLDRLVDEVDGVNHVALVLFVLDPENDGAPAGLARMIRYPDEPTEADVAVTVVDEYQGRGVATALLAELMRKRPAGVKRIVTEVAADNPPSLAMLRRLGPTDVTNVGINRLRVTVELPEDEGPAQTPDARREGLSPS